VSSELSRRLLVSQPRRTTMADEDPNNLLAENDGVNGEEDVENEDDDDDDDDNSEGDDMDDSGEDNDDEESGNDEDDDDDEEKMKNIEIFIRTFHNGNYDIQFEAALSYDRGVTLPARLTQASYNKPENWVERNRIGLEKMKRQLQNCIDSVYPFNESLELKLSHNGYGDELMDGEEPIVWYEPILDEYWDQLEAKIKQLGIVDNISDINIENVEMTKERLATLVTALSGQVSTIEYINFINANLCQEGIIWLSKLVDACPQLQTLFIQNNRIDNMESARCLSWSLKSHTCINQLWLNHCDLGSTPEFLSVILQSDIEYISLEHNNIDSLGAVKIAEYLENDPPTQYIHLECNRLNDDDAILISQALKKNTNLKIIFLRSNNLTAIGVKALLTCVFDSSSLNALSESNHTLSRLIVYPSRAGQDEWLHDCINSILLELDRTQKILLALQDKDSLLQHLANVTVELIPEVLAFPRREYNQQHCRYLNIVYSTMRWWNMPLLYSYQNCSDNMMSDRKRNRDN
jgi:hypothetical protein